jgi:hypothetical protein
MIDVVWDWVAWQRPAGRKAGFTLEGEGEEQHLVRIPGVEFKDYQPHPGIFRDLADVSAQPAGVLRFANRYGQLSNDPLSSFLSTWYGEIDGMRRLVDLSDALEKADWPTLSSRLGIKSKASADAVVDAAVSEIGRTLKRRLLDWPGSETEGAWNSRRSHVELRLKFHDLIGFMFFQVLHGLIGGRRYRPCEYCRKWFQVAPGKGRTDKLSCSPSCRYQLYRRRRRRARELHDHGRTVKQIARALGSEAETVRRWIAKEGT